MFKFSVGPIQFPTVAQEKKEMSFLPHKDPTDLYPSLLSPTGDTGRRGPPVPPRTPLQTQESRPPASLPPGVWALMIHGSVFAGPSHGVRPSPFLSRDSAKQNPSSLSSEQRDCLAPRLPAPPGSQHPEPQALWSPGHRNPGPQPLPSESPTPE